MQKVPSCIGHPCTGDTYCNLNTLGAVPYYAYCAPKAAGGAACSSDTDRTENSCVDGYYCYNDLSPTCKPRLDAGATCVGWWACVDGYDCTQPATGGTSTCQPEKHQGDACTTECPRDLYCDTQSTHTCIPPTGQEGDACLGDGCVAGLFCAADTHKCSLP